METTEVKSLESAVKQPLGASVATGTSRILTRKDLEKELVSNEHYKPQNDYFVKSVGKDYRLEVEFVQTPAPDEPLWYIASFKVSNGDSTGVQLYSASGHSYNIDELKRLQDDAIKSCCAKKSKIAEF